MLHALMICNMAVRVLDSQFVEYHIGYTESTCVTYGYC